MSDGAGAHRPAGAPGRVRCAAHATGHGGADHLGRGLLPGAGEGEPAHPERGAAGGGLERLSQREHDVAVRGRVQMHTIRVTGELADGPQRLPFPGARVAAKLVREAE